MPPDSVPTGRRRSLLAWMSGTLAALLTIAASAGYTKFRARRERVYTLEVSPLLRDADRSVLAHGEHLVRTLGGCAHCHGADLGGQVMSEDAVMRLVAPNLTLGAGSAVRGYTATDWVRAIVHGVDRHGRSLLVMPAKELGAFSDADVAAMIGYLERATPVDRSLGTSEVSLLGKLIIGLTEAQVFSAEFDHGAPRPTSPKPGPTPEYGRYLSNTCRGCHGPEMRGGIAIHPGAPPSADLSPEALASWAFEDFERALRTGKARDGHDLDEAMPWIAMKDLSADELVALWQGLRQKN